MNNKSEMEILYEQYLLSEDKNIKLNGEMYYKIIRKDRISINDGTVLICIPRSLFSHNYSDIIKDENDSIFKIGKPAFFSFRSRIPEWHLKTVTVNIFDIHEVNQIGDYVALV